MVELEAQVLLCPTIRHTRGAALYATMSYLSFALRVASTLKPYASVAADLAGIQIHAVGGANVGGKSQFKSLATVFDQASFETLATANGNIRFLPVTPHGSIPASLKCPTSARCDATIVHRLDVHRGQHISRIAASALVPEFTYRTVAPSPTGSSTIRRINETALPAASIRKGDAGATVHNLSEYVNHVVTYLIEEARHLRGHSSRSIHGHVKSMSSSRDAPGGRDGSSVLSVCLPLVGKYESVLAHAASVLPEEAGLAAATLQWVGQAQHAPPRPALSASMQQLPLDRKESWKESADQELAPRGGKPSTVGEVEATPASAAAAAASSASAASSAPAKSSAGSRSSAAAAAAVAPQEVAGCAYVFLRFPLQRRSNTSDDDFGYIRTLHLGGARASSATARGAASTIKQTKEGGRIILDAASHPYPARLLATDVLRTSSTLTRRLRLARCVYINALVIPKDVEAISRIFREAAMEEAMREANDAMTPHGVTASRRSGRPEEPMLPPMSVTLSAATADFNPCALGVRHCAGGKGKPWQVAHADLTNNQAQVTRAVAAGVLITQGGSHWADWLLKQRSAMGRPSAIMQWTNCSWQSRPSVELLGCSTTLMRGMVEQCCVGVFYRGLCTSGYQSEMRSLQRTTDKTNCMGGGVS